MSRNHRDLKVYMLADDLAVEAYRTTRTFPPEERWGLRSQIRRAAVSVPTNIVEGCARRSQKEYVHFLAIALGSASELRYLMALSGRLAFIAASDLAGLDRQADRLIRSLQSMLNALAKAHAASPRSDL